MIFVDSTVPMYLSALRTRTKSIPSVSSRRRLPPVNGWSPTPKCTRRSCTGMWPLDRRDAVQPAFDALLGVVDQVFAIDQAGAERARDILHGISRLSARDALHAAILQRHGVSRILTFEKGFSDVPGMERLS